MMPQIQKENFGQKYQFISYCSRPWKVATFGNSFWIPDNIEQNKSGLFPETGDRKNGNFEILQKAIAQFFFINFSV